MFDTICTLPLPSDVFAQVVHPTQPLFTIGLSSGHVYSYKLPSDADVIEDDSGHDSASPPKNDALVNGSIIPSLRRASSTSLSESGLGSIDTIWTTRRHKGSCRCLAFSHDGEICYSAGTDGLVKACLTETGKVVSKIAIPAKIRAGGEINGPTVLHALSPQALLLGTDAGQLYLQDLRQGGKEMQASVSQTWTPHGAEHINSLVPLPASETSTSGFPKQWVSVGGTTLAVTDLRKGTIATSEDQEIELTSVAMVQGLKKGGTSVGEKILVGQSDGVVSLWERGVWGDLDERIVLDRSGLSVDSLAVVPFGFGGGKLKMNEKLVAAGLEDGRVRFMRIGRNRVLLDLDAKHDDLDGVAAVGFDIEGRMITSGGQTVKVWTEAKGLPGGGRGASTKHDLSSDDDIDNSAPDQSSDEEDHAKQKRKKRKRNKGKDKSGGKALDFSL
ncbi:WD repeat-containing protein jip5 [Cladophialophora carrionii]|uniref:WD repeat-containing protein JIP5 n=1 Tax=Cladophialophora carrionii TaxID=86049 RepID=A0A1C1D1F4_9EURO|nr:WD repeat-containing protein jip5 [Cladophialophora carrionii]